jgi:hypothetical protein
MKIFIAALTTVWMLATGAQAHELDSNRATLVLRDRLHVSITFFVDYPGVLHQVLAPQRSVQEFVLMYASMKPPEFKAQLIEAQRQLQSNTALMLHGGKAAMLTQWKWPEAAVVQNLLQQRAMQAVVAPGDHAHIAPTEIRAEAKSTHAADFTSVTLKLPAQFQQVLVVSYRPKQVWLKPHAVSPAISF